jgi:hypothetical protein
MVRTVETKGRMAGARRIALDEAQIAHLANPYLVPFASASA